MIQFKWALLFILLALSACGGGGGGGGLIQTNDPNAVSDALTNKIAINGQIATKQTGDIPPSSTDAQRPVVTLLTQSLQVSNGQASATAFDVDSQNGALSALFAKVVGSDSVFTLNNLGTQKVVQNFNLEIPIPSNVTDGQFCIDIAAQEAALTSTPARICYDVESTADDMPVGGGALSQLQGTWVSECVGDFGFSEIDEFIFNGSRFQIRFREWENDTCSGSPVAQDTSPAFSFTLGTQSTSVEGVPVQAIDIATPDGTAFGILYVDGEQLAIAFDDQNHNGESAADRPTSLQFALRFTRDGRAPPPLPSSAPQPSPSTTPAPSPAPTQPPAGSFSGSSAPGACPNSPTNLDGGTANAAIDSIGDVDCYRFSLGAGGQLRIESFGETDVVCELYNANGNLVSFDDDGGGSLNCLIDIQVPNDTYFLEIDEFSNDETGAYSVELRVNGNLGT